MEHRGAEGADPDTGDGAGILLQIPDAFLRAEVGLRAAAGGPLRRGDVLPAARQPGGGHAAARGDRRGRGPARARLARRAGGRGRLRDDGALGGAADRPAVHRGGRIGRRPGRARAPAVRDPARGRAGEPRRPVDPEPLVADGRLQGDADRAAAAALLPRPARRARREPARARPLALLDQHLPELGARAPLSDARPQRRDQHAARQPQLDARPRAAARLAAVRRRRGQDPAAAARRHLRLGVARRPARAARARRPLARARDLDADPGGLPRPPRAAGRGARLLRLPLVARRALGRARRRRLLGRARDRRDARPQRPAPGALARQRRTAGSCSPRRRACSTSRRRRSRRRDGCCRASSSSSTSRRERVVPDDEIKRGLAKRRPYGQWLSDRVVHIEDLPGEDAARAARRADARQAARLRLDRGGPARVARADGARRDRADRLDGQRHGARGHVGHAPAALLLLQAAVRAGHEPGDRPDPRTGRDEPRGLHRAGDQPARRDARPLPPARDAAAAAAQPAAREAAPGRPQRLRGAHDRHDLAGVAGRDGDGAAARGDLRRGLGARGARRQHHHPVRPQPRRRPGGDAVAARGRGGPPPPRARGHPPPDRPRGRDGAGQGDPPRGLPDRLRRLRGQPVRDVRVALHAPPRGAPAGGHGPRGGGAADDQGGRQGPAQDPLEDGDLDDPLVHGRSDLRGGRARAGDRRQVLHGHAVARRRRGPERARLGVPRPPSARLPGRQLGAAARRRRLRLAPRRRVPRLEPGDDRDPAAGGAPRGRRRRLRALRDLRERGRGAEVVAARAAALPRDRRGHPAGRGRAGGGDRQALQVGRDVARARCRRRRTRRSPRA